MSTRATVKEIENQDPIKVIEFSGMFLKDVLLEAYVYLAQYDNGKAFNVVSTKHEIAEVSAWKLEIWFL